MTDAIVRPSWWRRWNWWKIGFFVLLVLSEGAREIIVLEAHAPAEVSTMASVMSFADRTIARGRWNRLDDGDALMPSSVLIDCRREEARCYEVSYSVNGNYAGSPDLSIYPARWGDDQISYENADPVCVRYSVRIDLKLEKVLAVRERKAKPDPAMAGMMDCSKIEPRMEITLTNGYLPLPNVGKGHFLPMFSLFMLVFGK